MLSPEIVDQSSLTGLDISVVRFPGDESPGYYHLVPPGRDDKNVKLTPMAVTSLKARYNYVGASRCLPAPATSRRIIVKRKLDAKGVTIYVADWMQRLRFAAFSMGAAHF